MDELKQQPGALRDLAAYYQDRKRLAGLDQLPPAGSLLLTGMGASYHAGLIAALHLGTLGFESRTVEAIDLLNYYLPTVKAGQILVYISQSGLSGEVAPILNQLVPEIFLVAITNNPDSPLAIRSQVILPLTAGTETLIAGKTYVNSLALLWLAARAWTGNLDGREHSMLLQVADQVEVILAQAKTVQERFLGFFEDVHELLFLGHGPQAVTAREAAMTLSEWAKQTANYSGIGAYRHGFIESVAPGMGVVVFAEPGTGYDSSIGVAGELMGYGAKVLLVQNGAVNILTEKLATVKPVDKFLTPILDIIPVQLYAEALARQLGIEPGFRHISKVVTTL